MFRVAESSKFVSEVLFWLWRVLQEQVPGPCSGGAGGWRRVLRGGGVPQTRRGTNPCPRVLSDILQPSSFIKEGRR